MTILSLQQRMHEAGRIRIGETRTSSKGKAYPAKLDRLRFTSSDQRKIEAVAAIYGGTARTWVPREGDPEQWEVITDASELDVIVPPTAMAFSQHMELWSGGGCQRRCEGPGGRELLSDSPCMCEQGAEDCKPHTRLSVMLPDLEGIGLWRLESHGWNAAEELLGAITVVQAAAGHGRLLPARLRLEERVQRKPGEDTRKFIVPVLDVDLPLRQIAAAGGQRLPQLGAEMQGLAQGGERPPPFTPIPAATGSEAHVPPVSEQVADHQRRADAGPQRNGRSAAPVARSGVKPRTAAQAAADADTAPSTGPLTDKQHADLTAWGIDDDKRHALVGIITGGRTTSSNELTQVERVTLVKVANAIHRDALRLEEFDDGRDPVLVDPTTSEVVNPQGGTT